MFHLKSIAHGFRFFNSRVLEVKLGMKNVALMIIATLLLLGCIQTGTKDIQSSNNFARGTANSDIGPDHFVIVAATYKTLGADDVKADEVRPFKFATKSDCELYLDQNMKSLVGDYKEFLKNKNEGRKLILLKCEKNRNFKSLDKKYIVFALMKKGTKTFVLEFKASSFETKENCLVYFNKEQALINTSLNKFIKRQYPDHEVSFIGCESKELFLNFENSLAKEVGISV